MQVDHVISAAPGGTSGLNQAGEPLRWPAKVASMPPGPAQEPTNLSGTVAAVEPGESSSPVTCRARTLCGAAVLLACALLAAAAPLHAEAPAAKPTGKPTGEASAQAQPSAMPVPIPRPRQHLTLPQPRPASLPDAPPRPRPAGIEPVVAPPLRPTEPPAPEQIPDAALDAQAASLAAISPAAGPALDAPGSIMAFAPMPPRVQVPEALQKTAWLAPRAEPLPAGRTAASAIQPPAPDADLPETAASGVLQPRWGDPGVTGGEPPEAELNILSDSDLALYASAFALQDRGKWEQADGVIALLADPVLAGHLRHQRLMHPTAYRSTFAELQRWLLAYGDHPDADRVHRLAQSRRPAGAELAAPWATDTAAMDEVLQVRGLSQPTAPPRQKAKVAAAPRGSLNAVRSDYHGTRWQQSLDAALKLAARHGEALPGASWYVGLSAWRLKRYALAAEHFAALAGYESADPWERAAGAYWAARAHLVLGQPASAILYLQSAANHPRTFYGLLASRRLGLDQEFGWSKLAGDRILVEALLSVPAVRRALALAQLGESDRAQAELTALMDARRRAGDTLFVPLLTGLLGMTGDARTAYRLARIWEQRTGEHIDPALYPDLPWEPNGGYTFDRALIYAFIRKESRFDPVARSPAGARGLMQLMPATARFVHGGGGDLSRVLDDPASNIDLGQRYIRHLERDVGIGRDLIRIVVAYNAGPGNMERWDESTRHGGDPLLFIESLPSAETRNFVERVLANFWIYRARYNQPSQGLDDLARGDWPRYVPMDEDIVRTNGLADGD